MIISHFSVLAAQTTTSDWVIATAVMVAGIALVVVLRQVVRVLTRSLRFQNYVSALVTRFVGAIVLLVAAVYALRQLGVEVGPLLGALGVGGILIAMSLQPVLGNLVASILLHARRPIRRGDQIYSLGNSGTVLDITGRAVVVLTFDGEMVYLPNLRVLEEPLLNQSAEDYRRTVIPFQVGYDADLRHTQQLLQHEIRALDALQDSPPGDVLVTGFGESGIDMVARVWHPSEELSARWAISEVAITIRETLARENITIPFPQRVVHLGDSAPTVVVDTTESGLDAR